MKTLLNHCPLPLAMKRAQIKRKEDEEDRKKRQEQRKKWIARIVRPWTRV